MATAPCHKPSERTSLQVQSAAHHQKTTTTETCHNENNYEQYNDYLFFTVKDMTRKIFDPNKNQGSAAANGHHTQKPTTNTARRRRRQCGGHCMPKFRVRRLEMKMCKEDEHKFLFPDFFHSSDSSSSSDSENENEHQTCKSKEEE